MKGVLVTADAVRRDRLTCYGYGRATTPFLNELANRTLLFRDAYSVSCHTREALPPILTGKPPDECLQRYRYQITAETLPQRLRTAGDVTTVGIASGPFLGRANNYHRGFDVFENCYRWDRNGLAMALEYAAEIAQNSHFVSGYEVNDRVVDQLDRSGPDENVFVWAHYMDVHAPYNRFSEWRWGGESEYEGEGESGNEDGIETHDGLSRRKIQYVFRKAKYAPQRLSPDEIDLLNDCYDNSLREFDRIMRDLFERIDDETNVIVTADHGESLGDNGLFAHKRELLDELLEIGMLVRNGAQGDVPYPVSTLDIAPTIADWFDVEFDGDGIPLRTPGTRHIEASCLTAGRRKRRRIQ